MSYPKTIVCLANSRKLSGRCVAGREITISGFGKWIRPVSARATQEISVEEQMTQDLCGTSILDVVTITMRSPLPQNYQTENHLIDDRIAWMKQQRIGWDNLQNAIENPRGPLWWNGYSSSKGHNDRVPEYYANSLGRSLYLIRPENLTLVFGFEDSRRRLRARFDLCGHHYHLAVTDPWAESRYLAGDGDETRLDDALLCISLGEIYKDSCAYKLVAAVITPQRAVV